MEKLKEINILTNELAVLLNGEEDKETEEIRRQALEDEREAMVDEKEVTEGKRGYGSDYEERLRNQNLEKV